MTFVYNNKLVRTLNYCAFDVYIALYCHVFSRASVVSLHAGRLISVRNDATNFILQKKIDSNVVSLSHGLRSPNCGLDDSFIVARTFFTESSFRK